MNANGEDIFFVSAAVGAHRYLAQTGDNVGAARYGAITGARILMIYALVLCGLGTALSLFVVAQTGDGFWGVCALLGLGATFGLALAVHGLGGAAQRMLRPSSMMAPPIPGALSHSTAVAVNKRRADYIHGRYDF
jgi:hypothetical protein